MANDVYTRSHDYDLVHQQIELANSIQGSLTHDDVKQTVQRLIDRMQRRGGSAG